MNNGLLWWKKIVIYELYVDEFAMNFKHLIDKLVYLKLLGVDCLLVLPHYPSPMVDGGYDVSDYKNVRKNLGTIKDFKEFIDKAHESRFKVIIDLILNHTSSEHPWFKNERSFHKNTNSNYYIWSKTPNKYLLADNPFFNFKQSNWIYNAKTDDYYYATFYPQQPDLNWDNPEVYSEIISIIDFWLDIGVDGFRLDAVSKLMKREGTDCLGLPETHQILKKIRSHIDKNYPNRILIAESDQAPFEARKYFGDGDECHLVLHFLLTMKTWLSIKRNDPRIINRILEKKYNMPTNCQWATFLTNHDGFSFYLLEKNERRELINWLDNMGNYSNKIGSDPSMRLAEVFRGNKRKIINAFKILFSYSEAPIIYYGEEIGMRNIRLLEKPRDPRLFVRGTFDWNEAKKQINESDSLLNHVIRMISEWRIKKKRR